jgi:hypothetical protein
LRFGHATDESGLPAGSRAAGVEPKCDAAAQPVDQRHSRLTAKPQRLPIQLAVRGGALTLAQMTVGLQQLLVAIKEVQTLHNHC